MSLGKTHKSIFQRQRQMDVMGVGGFENGRYRFKIDFFS